MAELWEELVSHCGTKCPSSDIHLRLAFPLAVCIHKAISYINSAL